MTRMKSILALLACLLAGPVSAQIAPDAPFNRGLYGVGMLSWIQPDNLRDLDDGFGGVFGIGYRYGPGVAVELEGLIAELDRDRPGSNESSEFVGANVSLLMFPLVNYRNLYIPVGFGYLDAESHAVLGQSFDGITFSGGIGYLLPVRWGDYDFGIRSEVRVRVHDDNNEEDGNELNGESMTDFVYNLGLHLPFGSAPPPPPPPPPPAPPPPPPPKAACADGVDNDNDALIDFPDDPGCSSADDQSEVDPKQCSDGKDNDGDGKIDFPDDRGCETASDDDEEDPCKKPSPGEHISLKGCGVGDILVLRGVGFSFAFDSAVLNGAAKATLDNVAEELTTYPQIKIELSGHTDSKGSDQYNQKLSERRAKSVRDYLLANGIEGPRVTAVGFGESQPVAGNDTEEGRALNRRVELMVTEGEAGVSGQ